MPLRRLLAATVALTLSLSAWAVTPAEVEALIKRRDPAALAQAQALVEAQDASAVAWTLLARAQMQKGDSEGALESAEEAVERDANNAQAQFWLGNSLGNRIGQVGMLRKMAMAPDLRDAYEAAIRLDPNLIEARQYLIQFYLQAPGAMGGGVDKAQAQVAEIARRNPVRGHLAQATLDRYNKDEAAMNRSIDAAVAAAPQLPADDVDSRLSLGLNLVALERYAQARDFFQRWSQAQPTLGAPHYQLGRLAAVSGQFIELGIASLQRYLQPGLTIRENDPEPSSAWWRLGQIQVKQGDKAAARTSFQTAVRLEPNNEEAKKALREL